jgi:endogenous inhibitor of DNA gyrase (YacG/DUF329 family)
VSAEQRDCLQCGIPFTWTSAAPKQKYCSTRCKHRWHQTRRGPRRRRHGRRDTTTDVARQPAPATSAVPTTAVVPSPPQAEARPGLTTEPACPHCRRPVALVAWLVPPAAASVKEPPRHADTVRDIP